MEIYVFVDGVRKSLMQLAQESGTSYYTLLSRYKAGVPGDELVPRKATGQDGFSPIAKVTQTETGAVITITDKTGTTTATVTNGGSATPYEIGSGLRLDDNVLSVDTATDVEEDNTRPITSAAVYAEIGNINAILATI